MVGGSKKILPADLPKELLERIVKCLDSETDVLRFRAVCNSWRSSVTPLKKSLPLKLPFPISDSVNSHPRHHGAYLCLVERVVYRFQFPEIKEPNWWLVKTERLEDGKVRILNPVSDRKIKIQPETLLPKVLNTLRFRVSEVCKCYYIRYVNPFKPKQNDEYKYAKKVAILWGCDTYEYAVMAIDDNNKLWYIKSGDEKWTEVGTRWESNGYLDVVNYKGLFYAVSVWGSTWVFDSSFEATKITGTLCGVYTGASKRHLVELYGELFLVEEVTDKDKAVCSCYDVDDGCTCGAWRIRVKNTTVEVKIRRIDELQKNWVEVKMLNANCIIFVGEDCSFMVSAQEFTGCKGSRVFYADRFTFFRTEEEKKPHYHDSFDYDCGDDDYDYGYNYFECDCCDSSDDDATFDSFIPSNDVKVKFRGLHGHNIGVCDFETGRIGSLLKFPEYADIFWPPPSQLSCNWSDESGGSHTGTKKMRIH